MFRDEDDAREVDIEDVMSHMRLANEAAREYAEAAGQYEGYSGGWALSGERDRMDDAEKSFAKVFNKYIDQRVDERLAKLMDT